MAVAQRGTEAIEAERSTKVWVIARVIVQVVN